MGLGDSKKIRDFQNIINDLYAEDKEAVKLQKLIGEVQKTVLKAIKTVKTAHEKEQLLRDFNAKTGKHPAENQHYISFIENLQTAITDYNNLDVEFSNLINECKQMERMWEKIESDEDIIINLARGNLQESDEDRFVATVEMEDRRLEQEDFEETHKFESNENRFYEELHAQKLRINSFVDTVHHSAKPKEIPITKFIEELDKINLDECEYMVLAAKRAIDKGQEILHRLRDDIRKEIANNTCSIKKIQEKTK